MELFCSYMNDILLWKSKLTNIFIKYQVIDVDLFVINPIKVYLNRFRHSFYGIIFCLAF